MPKKNLSPRLVIVKIQGSIAVPIFSWIVWLGTVRPEWFLFFFFFYSLVSLWELKRNFFSFLDSSYSSVSLVLFFWKCFLDSKSFIYFDQLINEGFSRGHLGYSVGGAVASWLVRSTPDRGPGFEMGTLRCVHEQDTWLSQCLSPPRCGETLQWTSILSRGE